MAVTNSWHTKLQLMLLFFLVNQVLVSSLPQPRLLGSGGLQLHKEINIGFNKGSYQQPLMIQPSIFRPQQTIIGRPQQTVVEPERNSLTQEVFTSPQVTEQFMGEQVIRGKTHVVEEEKEELVEQVKQTVIEEKVPTVIKTKIPTYIQETMKQKVIREQVPEMVQEQHTELVTQTKPIYVTETKPVTVTNNKMVMKTRDRVVNVPGETIITQGRPTVVSQQGPTEYSIVSEHVSGFPSGYYQGHPPNVAFRAFVDDLNQEKTVENEENYEDIYRVNQSPNQQILENKTTSQPNLEGEMKPVARHPQLWDLKKAYYDKILNGYYKFIEYSNNQN